MCEVKKYNSLLQVINAGEKECRDHLAQLRWNGNPVCTFENCGHTKAYKTKSGRYKCAKCKRMFSVTTGSIFHDTKLPLKKWFYAIYLITSHKKGISSIQLAKDLEVTQTTGWYILHRIRYMIRTKSFNKPLEDIVEVDETYVGGKEKNKHKSKRTKGTQGRSVKTKTPVLGIVQREGELRAEKVTDTKSKTLQPIIEENVKEGTQIMSDEWWGYKGLNESFDHHVIKHSEEEYVRGIVHTNTIEGFWSQFKRGVYGVYHQISEKHTQAYLNEFEFKYNTRKMSEGERLNLAIKNCSGVLKYKDLIK